MPAIITQAAAAAWFSLHTAGGHKAGGKCTFIQAHPAQMSTSSHVQRRPEVAQPLGRAAVLPCQQEVEKVDQTQSRCRVLG